MKHPLAQAKNKYREQYRSAIGRNIPFLLTFDEWYNWWLSNGIDKNAPANKSLKTGADPCMCRKNDSGPYELSNIFFATRSFNIKNAPNKNKAVQTPDGVFATIKEAAKHYNITDMGMIWRLKNTPGFDYL